MPKKPTRSTPYRRFVYALAALLIAPYVLTFAYRFIPPISTWMVYDVVTFTGVKRDWVALERISPNLIRAVLAAEDSAFCSHWGVDFKQMQRSIEEAIDEDRDIRATSTITQQTVKNLYLWSGRSWIRKSLEFPLTFWTEIWWPKRRILEVYLNIVEWGEGVYGAEAAARHHFGVSARDLSGQQAALLAAAWPNPLRRDASRPGPAHRAIAGNIQRRAGVVDVSCLR